MLRIVSTEENMVNTECKVHRNCQNATQPTVLLLVLQQAVVYNSLLLQSTGPIRSKPSSNGVPIKAGVLGWNRFSITTVVEDQGV